MLDGKIDSVIGRFRGGRSGLLGVMARLVSNYVSLFMLCQASPNNVIRHQTGHDTERAIGNHDFDFS
jgi:ABC-type enterochelin transport system ATPase subunit